MPALLIGGELHGQRVPVRLGLNGLPRFLVFPRVRVNPGTFDEPIPTPAADIVEDRYRLYDDVPAKYLHESEWKDDGDDDDGPNDNPVTPTPGLLVC